MKYLKTLFLFLLFFSLTAFLCGSEELEKSFVSPEDAYRPETWFHLIGGNVNEEALTVDLEAVRSAGIRGIQLFHGRGREWEGVSPQIQTLSPTWDGLIERIGDETERLDLEFTMQNCPGWAMSGGPWMTPENAMRHLIWDRTDLGEGGRVNLYLPIPQPSSEDWRDYRDIMVLAFPTPHGDQQEPLVPTAVRSNRNDIPWKKIITDGVDKKVDIAVGDEPIWIEVTFDAPTFLRSIEFPPTEITLARRSFDPDCKIVVHAMTENGEVFTGSREVPRGNWQDRQPEYPISLAFSDVKSKRFRITIEHEHALALLYLRMFSGARINDWRSQSGYALRSLERQDAPVQDPLSTIDPGKIVDLTDYMDETGNLSWDAPEGQWTIVRYGHVNTGVTNKPAPPEATGFECDKLSLRGANQHFDGYIGRLAKPGGVIQGKLDGMLIDSWECYTQTWTRDMEQEFEERRGYALRKWLPALAGWVVADHDTSERFLRDWRKTISDLMVDYYFGRMAELGRENGLKLSFETAVGDVSPGDILQYFGKADIPMCEIWQPNDPHWGGFETKPILPTVSAARMYGKPLVAAEAFTNVPVQWNEHPYMLKHQADRHFALGVNHLVFHTYTHNPRLDVLPGTSFGNKIGSPFLRGQTWWNYMPLFTDYLSRCHLLLQQGKPVSDVLWYLGDDLDHKPRQDTPFPTGYQFDYLNFDVLMNRISVNDAGRLETPEGIQWEVLWLAPEQCRRMTTATLQRLKVLIEDGARVIGSPPERNASLESFEEEGLTFESLRSEIWGASPSHEGDHALGKGRVLWGISLCEALNQLGLSPDVLGDRTVSWIHREIGDEQLYFIAADRDDPIRSNFRFRSIGKPVFWDPMTGKRQEVLVYHVDGNYTTIPLELEASGSLFVMFEHGDSEPIATRVSLDGKPLLDAHVDASEGEGIPYPNFGLSREEIAQPWVDPRLLDLEFAEKDGVVELIAWQDGRIQLDKDDEGTFSFFSKDTLEIELNHGWTLDLDKDWGALEGVALPELCGWSKLDHLPSKMYSGTGVYRVTLNVERPADHQRVLLDLGRVENIAEVEINGISVGVKWAPPYRFDITDYISGENDVLQVIVCNTWRNRLIFDANQEIGDRKTWTLHGPTGDSEIDPAGILGPAKILVGNVFQITSSSNEH